MMTRAGQQVVFAGLSPLFTRYFPCSWPEARRENPAGIWPLETCLSAPPGPFVHNRYCLCELKLFVLRYKQGEARGVIDSWRGVQLCLSFTFNYIFSTL